jgi:hypothetical protein
LTADLLAAGPLTGFFMASPFYFLCEGAEGPRVNLSRQSQQSPVEAESVLLKRPDQALEVNRAYGGHAVISCSS